MKNRLLLTLFVLTAIAINANADTPADEGKKIFTTRCAACHNVNKAMTGPALAGIDQRRDIEWIINFVHSSQALVKKGDAYSVALFEKFNKVPMPDHPDLTADNIKNVVEYIKSQSNASDNGKAPFAKPGKKRAEYLPLSLQKDYWFFIVYLGAVTMLISALLFAVQLQRFKNRKLNKENLDNLLKT